MRYLFVGFIKTFTAYQTVPGPLLGCFGQPWLRHRPSGDYGQRTFEAQKIDYGTVIPAECEIVEGGATAAFVSPAFYTSKWCQPTSLATHMDKAVQDPGIYTDARSRKGRLAFLHRHHVGTGSQTG